MNSLLLKFMVALIFVSEARSISRASFGDACDKGIRCDSRSSLTCTDGLCQCIKSEEMTFDNKTRKCVVLSSERCSYTAVEISETTQEKRWTEKLECVENAVCSTDGYCCCTSEYFETTEGFCVPKKTNGEDCRNNDECRVDKKLICIEGKCSCNNTEAIFDYSTNQCIALAGANCVKYNSCVRNAYCPRRQGYHRQIDYTRDSTCNCHQQFKQSKKGLCLVTYGGSCHPEIAPCSEEWACINDKCQCHFPNHQYYNTTLGDCVSNVGGPCLESIESNEKEKQDNIMAFTCVENADCKEVNGIHECGCMDGFIENKDKCKVAHGQPCGTGQMCDEVANLICKNGRCSCPDFQIYDDTILKCRGLVGSKCLLNATNFCIEGASCESYRAVTIDEGICRCAIPSDAEPNRMCKGTAKKSLTSVTDNDALVSNTLESIEQNLLILENTLNITEVTSPV